MYLPIPTQQTPAAAWLEAVAAVNSEAGHETHNVIIDVAEPLTQSAADRRVLDIADRFLRTHGALPLQSVANTVFPQELYRRHGEPALYDVYGDVYERIKKKQGDWGRYFERMIRRPTADGKMINPLADLVSKMRQHVHGGGKTFRNIYELAISDSALDVPIYDPERDAGPVMNRQCLSFLSFKLDHDNSVMLTALYRNHYYIERLLGNLIGLARLMAFVGQEASVPVGALTVISTHAVIDTPKASRRSDVDELLADCVAVYKTSQAA